MASVREASSARYRIRSGVLLLTAAALIAAAILTGCGETGVSFAPEQSRSATPPPGVISVAVDGASREFWPYTGADLSGTPQDPVNLVFTGHAGARAIRAALLSLNGDRVPFGLPAGYPFDCIWSDAIGDLQVAYTAPTAWIGSAVQLQCGNYGPVRFHLRLFEAGGFTVANAHFELLVPGTADHQVLSWELAEQLVAVDMRRTGLLDPTQPLGATAAINQAPFRTIPAQIYNLLPAELTAAIGGPPGPAAGAVPIGNDGSATVVRLTTRPAIRPGELTQSFPIEYDQVLPRPFCAAAPNELVRVRGPVTLRKLVRLTSSGELTSEFHADGRLEITPINPSTGQPSGASYEAEVQENQTTSADDRGNRVRGHVLRIELPAGESGHGRLSVVLDVKPDGAADFRRTESCNP